MSGSQQRVRPYKVYGIWDNKPLAVTSTVMEKRYVVTTKKARSETLTDHVHFSDILLRQTKITEQFYT